MQPTIDHKEISKGIVRAVIILGLLALALYLLSLLGTVITYLIIAGILALLGRPLTNFLQKRLKSQTC